MTGDPSSANHVVKIGAYVPISAGMLDDGKWFRALMTPCDHCELIATHHHDCPNHTCDRACPDHQWTWRDHRDHLLEQTRRTVATSLVAAARRITGDSEFPGCYCDE